MTSNCSIYLARMSRANTETELKKIMDEVDFDFTNNFMGRDAFECLQDFYHACLSGVKEDSRDFLEDLRVEEQEQM